MALVRWEPARELQTIQQEMNRLFGSFFDSSTATAATNGAARRWIPPMDLLEEDSQFVLRADLPGVSEDAVKVELEDNVLTVSGERKSEHEERKDGFYRVERSFGRFSRTVTLPEGVSADGIQATFDNGVLEVHVQKPEQPKPQKVAISVGHEAKTIDRAEDTESSPAA
jgi:HSP20 family protein